MVADEVGRSGVSWECLDDLLRQLIRPSHAGSPRTEELAMPVTSLRGQTGVRIRHVDYAQIDCYDRIGIVAQTRSPGLRLRPAMAVIYFESRLSYRKPKLEQHQSRFSVL